VHNSSIADGTWRVATFSQLKSVNKFVSTKVSTRRADMDYVADCGQRETGQVPKPV